jgi:hypothetical protein
MGRTAGFIDITVAREEDGRSQFLTALRPLT